MTDLLTLPEAAKHLNKSGAISAKTLRTAVHKGLLQASRIGRKWMVTESQLDEYRQRTIVKCHVAPAPLTSTCVNVPDVRPSGSSVTGKKSLAQAAAEMELQKLKDSLRRTSRTSTPRPVPTTSARSRLPTS